MTGHQLNNRQDRTQLPKQRKKLNWKGERNGPAKGPKN